MARAEIGGAERGANERPCEVRGRRVDALLADVIGEIDRRLLDDTVLEDGDDERGA